LGGTGPLLSGLKPLCNACFATVVIIPILPFPVNPGERKKRKTREMKKRRKRDEERKKKRKEPCEKGLPLKRNDYRLCVPPRGDFADFLLENLSSVRRSASEQV
jgi:hypothetical protein